MSNTRKIVKNIKNYKNTIKKIFKILSYCFLLSGLWYQTRRFYTKLKITPEIFTKENFVKGREIPFPAVTFCPNYLPKDHQTPEFMESHNLTKSHLKLVDELLCGSLMPDGIDDEVKEKLLFESLKLFSPKFEDSINLSRFSTFYLHKQNFSVSYTEFGICYTFNSLGYSSILKDDVISAWHEGDQFMPSNWTLQDGYLSDKDSVYPLRTSPFVILKVNFYVRSNENFCSENKNKTFIKIHLPNELPTPFSPTFSKTFNENIEFHISAEVKLIDESLKELSPKQRGCYYEGEKQLKFFKTYSKVNCDYECFTNFTYDDYGCVPFMFPRTKDMELCSSDILSYNVRIMVKNWPKKYYTEQKNPHLLPVYPCDCMEPCRRINYKIVKESLLGLPYLSSYGLEFVDAQVSLTTTYITYKLENFIFDLFGLFGLFLGSSIASLFMIPIKIYNFVSEKLHQKRPKNLQPELELELDQGTTTDIPEKEEVDREQSAMSEISRNIYILSHGHATFVPVATKL
ncbi:unnamed protein product [Chironomus riparius]|uniref:Uncharacterized protein n=1 Tax=Chironomus riparius TaxID=315576 RepID=A0A9N9S8Z9_9DIPT|nr:unnamed protein product [Chironomus riparius]